MTRLHILLASALAALTLSACTAKPSEESCRKAITNMRRLMGTENFRDEAGMQGEVRRCKGGSKKKAVDCAVAAQSLDDLRKCSFFKVPENAPGIDGPPMGSAAGSAMAGSAMTGSAAGSATTGSAAGSAMTGSAAGSAMTGSAAGSAAGTAMTGSAAGSAAGTAMTGSAAGSAAGSAMTGSAATSGAMPGTPAGSGVVH